LRYENGQVKEENMIIEWLVKIALACGRDESFCCSQYHVFIVQGAGTQVKQYRKSQGLTQRQLAAQLGVNVATVRGWELEKNKPPIYVWELVSGLRSIEM